MDREKICADPAMYEPQTTAAPRGAMGPEEGEEVRLKILRTPSITPFQQRVYLELLKIPPGETITYGELARRIGCRSAQAVGQALRRNPFAPEVPCHRVVAADGSLGGFYGRRDGTALERKRSLLALEGVAIKK